MAKIDVDFDLIRRLADLLEETGLTEIELGEGERRVRVARAPGTSSAARQEPAERAAEVLNTGPVPTGPQLAPIDGSHPGAVTSPMVGTVYLSPEPEAPPFITVGDQVAEGQTLIIVEAMKTMNPIRAPRSGKVTQILVENGAPVEYGEVLLILQ